MDDLTIRPIAPEELPMFMQALERAFHGRFREEDVEQERLIAEPDRYFAALEGDVIVGTAGACSTQLTVPGGLSLPPPGTTPPGVLPSPRRPAINRPLMAALLLLEPER